MFGTVFDSFLLSQIFGLYLIISSIIMLSRANFYRHLVRYIDLQHGTLIIGASFGLLLGLFLVDAHNIWILKPRVVVTLFCWFILIQSLLWLSIPEKMLVLVKRVYAGVGYYVLVYAMLVIGIGLVGRGLYLFLKHNLGF